MKQFSENGWLVHYINNTQVANKRPTVVSDTLIVYHSWESFEKSVRRVDVFYSTWAFNSQYVSKIPNRVCVYDRLDDFVDWEPYEQGMLDLSDIVFTSSQPLYDKTCKKVPNTLLVRNACDFDFISKKRDMPKELLGLSRPIVCFIGALGAWVDVEVIKEVANSYTVLVIGPEFGNTIPNNVYYTGIKPYSHLPYYYQHIDLGIIPFNDGRVALAANPIKMYEYLAAGKPVVATDLPEMRLFPNHVYTVGKGKKFTSIIEKALVKEAEGGRGLIKKRLEIAKVNTWNDRFKVMETEIVKKLNEVLA